MLIQLYSQSISWKLLPSNEIFNGKTELDG